MGGRVSWLMHVSYCFLWSVCRDVDRRCRQRWRYENRSRILHARPYANGNGSSLLRVSVPSDSAPHWRAVASKQSPLSSAVDRDVAVCRYVRAEQVRHASLLAVKTRMKSVENIKKITSAMKMVAASKMRMAKQRVGESRGIVKPLVRFLGDMPGLTDRR